MSGGCCASSSKRDVAQSQDRDAEGPIDHEIALGISAEDHRVKFAAAHDYGGVVPERVAFTNEPLLHLLIMPNGSAGGLVSAADPSLRSGRRRWKCWRPFGRSRRRSRRQVARSDGNETLLPETEAAPEG